MSVILFFKLEIVLVYEVVILSLVFNVKTNMMDNVDLDIISDVESKCFNGNSLSFDEINYYLNYIVYKVRCMLVLKKESNINNYNFNFMCDTAQSIIARYFDDLNIVYKPVETQKAITNDILGHSFLLADFMVDGENRSYIIDPTYNQFFDVDRCQENNFKVINNVVVKTPDLGYFALKENESVQGVIKNLIRCGFTELSCDSAKIYGDLFYKTKTGNINYFNSKLEMSGDIYIKGFKNSPFKLTYTKEELDAMNMLLSPIYKNDLKIKK